MTGRRLLFVTHRYVGLTAGLFLLIAAVTGCLLVFRTELDAMLNPRLFAVGRRPVLPAIELVRRVQQAHPGWQVQSFDLRTQPGHTLRLGTTPLHSNGRDGLVDGADQLFVDPADAHVVGMRTSRAGIAAPNLLQAIYTLHYTLLAGTAGRWLMGIVALAWLALNVLGVCVTWPRRRPWLGNWRPAWTSNAKALENRPMPELHRIGGLWLLLPLTVLAYTSVAMNFYDELFRPLIETLSPPRPSPFDRPAVASPAGILVGFEAAEQAAIAAASRQTPHLSPVAINNDTAHGFYEVAFAPDGTRLYEGFGRVTYSVDRQSGRVMWVDQPRLDGAGRLVLRSLYPLHSGQVFGLPSRLLVLLLGLVTAGLAITGVLPWWRRRQPQRKR